MTQIAQWMRGKSKQQQQRENKTKTRQQKGANNQNFPRFKFYFHRTTVDATYMLLFQFQYF